MIWQPGNDRLQLPRLEADVGIGVEEERLEYHHLCLAWNWKYDASFVALLAQACREGSVNLLQVTPDNLAEVLAGLERGEIGFGHYWDRATDADPAFLPLAGWAERIQARLVNPNAKASLTWDKAAMHLALLWTGLQTPHTLIIPSALESPELPEPDLSPLGGPFIIKPAHGGGGDGVVMEAATLAEVCAARLAYPDDKYLLQAHISPVALDRRDAWFRVIYCLGDVLPCWWDTVSHLYLPVTPEEETRHGLAPLREITARIAEISGLDLFSTEIALSGSHQFVIVDYVNDPLDLRLQSETADGVPDDIIARIVRQIVYHVGPMPAGC